MKFRFLLSIVIAAVFCDVAYAKPKQNKDAATSEESSTTSLSERASPKFSIGAEMSIMFTYVFNVSVGYIVNPSLMIEAYRETPTYVPIGPDVPRGYLAGIKFRYFAGNSFNLSFSPYYRRIDYAGEAPANHVGVSAALGNRWQWERAYFGVDWLGAGTDRRVVSGSITNKESGFPILLRMVAGLSI